MQKFKPQLSLFLLAATFAVQQPAWAEPEAEGHDPAHAHHTAKEHHWLGVYNGFLPCADCAGVKTQLGLNKNGSYILMTTFSGRSEREFVEKGKFTWDEKKDTVTLMPKKEGAIGNRYLIGNNILTQLDSAGNLYTGKLAERYVLRRNEITEKEPSHAH
ncbi:copper resistance protein NlpE [Methylomonas sp. EFPC3]|uniref:copper resistance protein NlpE n=2 Tax=unclassified Methylomonas TaxID=2608980 RepID=UPI00241675BC|nr:copper resistance protein NlpE [Methylomonas sp. EFPC3]WFP50884.1 copper resistance protein NlpE [Methylomonas sp. EFPC3]